MSTRSSKGYAALFRRTALVLFTVLLGFLVFRAFISHPLASCPAGVAGPARLRSNASELMRTFIAPALDTPLGPGTNVIWCGSLQLAWNQLIALAGEDIHMSEESPAVSQLNRSGFTTNDVDADTCLVTACPASDREMHELRSRIRTKFKGAVIPELIPDPATLSPNLIVLYAALFANLPFASPFERLEYPFDFCSSRVAAFGIDEYYCGSAKRERSIRSQVKVCDYQGPDDFIIELKTTRARHQLILAKTKPMATLADAVHAVLMRVAAPGASLEEFRYLSIPATDFDITRNYPELCARPLVVSHRSLRGLPLVAVCQSIRFKLDKKGALLESEATAIAACMSAEKDKPDLIFDKPFLVLLKLASSDTPYFAMWVENAEVLVPYALLREGEAP